MSNCLVTTLKESVNDAELLKIGELRIKLKHNGIKRFGFGVNTPATLTVEGEGYITDSTGTSNLGKTASVPVIFSDFYLSANTKSIVISDKYAVRSIQIFEGSTNKECTIEMDASDFMGMDALQSLRCGVGITGDIKYLGELEKFEYLVSSSLVIHSGTLGGDVASLENLGTLFTGLWIRNNDKLYGSLDGVQGNTRITGIDITNTPNVSLNTVNTTNCTALTQIHAGNSSITGDIRYISDTLQYFTVANTDVSGDLSSISNKTALRVLNLSGTQVTGDTSSLANLTNLTEFNYTNTAITGTWPLT